MKLTAILVVRNIRTTKNYSSLFFQHKDVDPQVVPDWQIAFGVVQLIVLVGGLLLVRYWNSARVDARGRLLSLIVFFGSSYCALRMLSHKRWRLSILIVSKLTFLSSNMKL
jgi:hypothetical protein